jgi:hypothetical protein
MWHYAKSIDEDACRRQLGVEVGEAPADLIARIADESPYLAEKGSSA